MVNRLKKSRLTFITISACLFAVIFWFINTIAYQALIIERHSSGQDRLLDYIIELRGELESYRILPYALADNPTLLRFISSPYTQPQIKQQLTRHLEDLTHVSKTQDWLVLSPMGERLLSSNQNPDFDINDYFAAKDLQKVLNEQQGEPVLISGYNRSLNQATHLALAPVYTSAGLVGAVAVSIDVNDLIERWSLSGDLVIMTDQNNLIFLANRINNTFNMHWIDEAKHTQLFNFIQTKTYFYNQQNYLLQSVILDDLKWQIHYFSGLNNIEKKAHNIAFISLGVCALIWLFWLYRRERSLKIQSKLENEALIAKSAQLQRALIERTHVGLLQLNANTDIDFINPMGLRYFGDKTNLIGRKLKTLLPARDENLAAIVYLQALAEKQLETSHFLEQEVLLQRDNGELFPALLSISSLEWSDSHGHLVTLINISKRKDAELRLKEMNAQLEERVLDRTIALEKAQKELLRSEKLAAIGQMSTAIAHELNQPLTGIKTLAYTAELLLKRQQSDQAIKTLIDLADLVSRMQNLTSELKVLAYRRPEQLQATSIEDCLQNAIKSLGEGASKIHWQVSLSQAPLVMAEPIRLERILSNLISNSLQACSEHNISPMINISLNDQDSVLTLHYSDNGKGIEEEQLTHLFEPFFTTKPIGKGLGLGLAISANLAKDMNGKLCARQTDNSQLLFLLTLQKANYEQ
ncbi:sensor histidine kinase [Marinomonas epiphytica]